MSSCYWRVYQPAPGSQLTKITGKKMGNEARNGQGVYKLKLTSNKYHLKRVMRIHARGYILLALY